MTCEVCEGEHEPGSADWRDCQAELFDRLVEQPEKWQFKILPDQSKRVSDAYQEYKQVAEGGLPDVEGLRVVLSRQFTAQEPNADGQAETVTDVRGMTRFWTEFVSDMPEVMLRHGGLHARSLNIAWTDRKIRNILAQLKLDYLDWETEEVAANLKSIEGLRKAADAMEMFEAANYALYHLETKENTSTWYFRKSRIVTNTATTQEEKRS